MSTPLDQDLIPYEKITFDSKTGPIANPQASGFAWPLLFIAVICFFMLTPGSIIIGILLLIGSTFIIFSYRGVSFDLGRNMYREYSAYFGFMKVGEWKSCEPFPFVSVLSKQMANTLRFVTTLRYRDYSIYLLSDDHRTRIKIAEANDEESALRTANIIADKLNKACAVYNPPKRAGKTSRGR